MDATGIIILLAVGAVAGWLAGNIIKGGGFGLIGNIIVGLVGSIIGGAVFNWLGIRTGGGWLGLLLAGVVGAVILLFIVGLFKRA